jgi:uncharacterized membrane protein
MRWLLIALLVSLAALLIAAVGSALHIRRQRARVLSEVAAGAARKPDSSRGQAEEAEIETEI